MNKFSIKIDLSTFFEDERKMVLIMVDPMWENVKSLQNRVENLFDVDSIRFLNNEGCFLPPQEPIEIVRFCKDLKAFIPKDSLEKRKRKKSKKHSEEKEVEVPSTAVADLHDESQKKRKYRSLECGFASSTPNNSKRIKNNTAVNAILKHPRKQINKSSEISSTTELMPPPSVVPTEKGPKSLKSASNLSSMADDVDRNLDLQENVSMADKVPRKSKRKNKSSKPAEEKSIETSETATERISTLPSSTFINENRKSRTVQRSSQNPFKKRSSNMNHIHFDESGEISTTTNKTQNKENDVPAAAINIVFHSTLHETDPKTPRIFQINRSSAAVARGSEKPRIEIQEDIILKPILSPNSLSTSQAFEAISKDTTVDASVVVASLEGLHSGDIDKSSINDINCTEQAEESSVDEGNSTFNDTNVSAVSIATKKCTRKSSKKAQLDENQSANITTVTDDAAEEQSKMDISLNKSSKTVDDELSSHCKDENESSIVSVDCVDLSLDLDEEDEVKQKKKRVKSSINIEDVSISDTSDVEEVSEVIDLNESEDISTSRSSLSTLQNQSNSSNTVKVANIISLCKDTKELPNIGDIMMFKVPFTNRKGNPDCTKFLAGVIERVQHRTKSLKLLILDGHSELVYVPAKHLDNFLEDSSCDQKYIQIKFNEMIQPRLLPKNKRSLFSFNV